jgi:hypothetical protein
MLSGWRFFTSLQNKAGDLGVERPANLLLQSALRAPTGRNFAVFEALLI